MATMTAIDFVLGIIMLAIVPFVLAAYGGPLAAQTIADATRRRNTKIRFWSLCVLGIFVAILYQYRVEKNDEGRELKAAKIDAERQKKTDEAQRQAIEAQADLRAIEKSNGDQILSLQKQLDRVIARAQSPEQVNAARQIKDELAGLTESLKRQSSPNQPLTLLLPPSTPPVPEKPCRGDDLGACSDEELLGWGNPLMQKIQTIEDAHMASLKALDDIKGHWLGFVIGKDKDSKYLKAYAEAQEKAADQFRDCCAEDALRYHAQLAMRTGGGSQDSDLYEWIQKLLKPSKSKQWKEAKQEGGSKVVGITGNLVMLQIALSQKISSSKTKTSSR